jgi:hypothetical protein
MPAPAGADRAVPAGVAERPGGRVSQALGRAVCDGQTGARGAGPRHRVCSPVVPPGTRPGRPAGPPGLQGAPHRRLPLPRPRRRVGCGPQRRDGRPREVAQARSVRAWPRPGAHPRDHTEAVWRAPGDPAPHGPEGGDAAVACAAGVPPRRRPHVAPAPPHRGLNRGPRPRRRVDPGVHSPPRAPSPARVPTAEARGRPAPSLLTAAWRPPPAWATASHGWAVVRSRAGTAVRSPERSGGWSGARETDRWGRQARPSQPCGAHRGRRVTATGGRHARRQDPLLSTRLAAEGFAPLLPMAPRPRPTPPVPTWRRDRGAGWPDGPRPRPHL